MSTIAADVLDRSPYAAPEADLRIKGEPTEDKLFNADGRIGVMRYNTRVLQGFLMILVGSGVGAAAIYSENTVAIIIAVIPSLIALFAGLALMVYSSIKRLHDLNFSGWFYLIGIIPLVGAIWVLYYAIKPARPDDNRFGSRREATQGDKIMGVIGIVLTVLITLASALPSSYF